MRSLWITVLMLLLLGTSVLEATAQSRAPHSAGPATAQTVPPDSTDSLPEPVEFNRQPWEWTESYFEDHADDYMGADESADSPYERESILYRSAPPLRYNRVEGLVLGVRREPLSLRDPHETARIYGQVGYAFSLNDIRYTVGIESKLRRDLKTGLKIGARYQKETLTPDRWKTSFVENSLASLGFGYDFFDYYEAEGLSVYAVQALPPTLRLTAGFRTEEHRPLAPHTQWSVFEGGTFRTNPAAERGRLQAGILSLTGGRIENQDDLPRGAAFRAAATLGTLFGGDFHTNRYEVDGRLFVPLTPDTRLGLRLRGGYATSGVPPQMKFTLGGIGSVRSYDQNALRGTRMLLGNAEYIIDGATLDNDLLEDVFLVGLVDAGWVGQPGQRFRSDDILPAAGFGIGLDEQQIRLDIAWPLRSGPETGSRPSIWLRISPNF